MSRPPGKNLGREILWPVPARPVPDRTVICGVEAAAGAARVAMTHERVRRALVTQLFGAQPPLRPAEDVYALEVLAEILGGGPTSRLYRRLVVDKNRHCRRRYYSGDNFGPGQFGLWPAPSAAIWRAGGRV